MRFGVLMITAMLTGCGSAGSVVKPPAEPERVVEQQLEAYNRGDIAAFAATYADDVRIYDFPDQLRFEGIEELRKRYGTRFAANPNLHATITKRIVQGRYVIDHEHVRGLADGSEIFAIALYEIRNGKIQNVWFIR